MCVRVVVIVCANVSSLLLAGFSERPLSCRILQEFAFGRPPDVFGGTAAEDTSHPERSVEIGQCDGQRRPTLV